MNYNDCTSTFIKNNNFEFKPQQSHTYNSSLFVAIITQYFNFYRTLLMNSVMANLDFYFYYCFAFLSLLCYNVIYQFSNILRLI